MGLLPHFLRSAVQNLLRGGQRVFVALLCITFGVMSVVSMALLSEALQRMMVVKPSELIGADITMDHIGEDAILPDQIDGLKALQQQGKIEKFTLVAHSSTLVYRMPGSGELHFPTYGMGIDPAVYPLAGAFRFTLPGAASQPSLAEAIRQPGDVLVTRDLMDEQGLRVGDTLLLSDLTAGVVVEGRVRGMVTDTPNHQGGKIYYSLETARALAGGGATGSGGTISDGATGSGGAAVNTALALASDPQAAMQALESQGWRTYSAVDLADSQRDAEEMIEMSLKGAGILGMLVGGIGIANTMQVLLRRRRREIAIFKTLGYQQGQLELMFACEAGLLGALGSLLGAGIGVGISYVLVQMFTGLTDLLIHWVLSPLPVIYGILIGVVTTISFAMFAIVVNSRVRPLAVLRSEALDSTRIPWFQSLGLLALCCLPFTAVTALVMGSLLKGVGVLVFALVGLVGLGGLLGGIVWVLTRLFPLRAWPLLHMARNNLRRRGFALVFAMIALFVGVVSLALGIIVTTSAQRAYDGVQVNFEGDNLTIIAPAAQVAAIQQAAQAQPAISHTALSYQTPVRAIHAADKPDQFIPAMLIGAAEPYGFQVEGAPWGSQAQGVYVNSWYGIKPGSQVGVTRLDGSTITLPVVGTYKSTLQGASPQPPFGLLMDAQLSQKLVPPQTVQFFLRAPASQVKAVSAALGTALPDALVVNLPAYAARYTQAFKNLFVFAASMAGLALLAGVLLIANSVSLAMLDRRYEIGVLKAVGYARRQVLLTLVVEYSLAALIATGVGLFSIEAFLWIAQLSKSLIGSLLVLTPASVALIALLSVGLPLVTVLGVTWRPVQVSPLVVLNDRE